MANRSRRTKLDVSSSSETTSPEDDLRATVSRFQSELDVERKCSRQLRREKAHEVHEAREQEQNRSALALKDLAARLHREKQRELEFQKETLRCRHEADTAKVVKQKEQEVKRLRRDLGRCQEELKEEVTKRGLSTSARGAFELERTRLLQELKELSASKKQLEDALRSAAEAAKQNNLETRQVQDACKHEIGKVTKEANAEIRKLVCCACFISMAYFNLVYIYFSKLHLWNFTFLL